MRRIHIPGYDAVIIHPVWLSTGITCIILVGSIYWYSHHNNPQSSAVVAATATVHLNESVEDIAETFNTPPSNSSRVTTRYIGDLEAVLDSCRSAVAAARASDDKLVASGALLCQDLFDLSAQSLEIQRATKPLLTATAHVRRYQTLPPLRDNLRNRQLSQVSTAIRQLTELQADKNGFRTAALDNIRELQRAMQSAKNLGYMPQLQEYQIRMQSERQRYWTSQVDIATLRRTLQTQVDSYCQYDRLMAEAGLQSACRP